MGTALLSGILRNLPNRLFILALVSYPFIGYLVIKIMGQRMSVSKAFGLICLALVVYKIGNIYRKGTNIVLPYYVLLFGLFAGYTLFCGMFVTDYFDSRGMKYFYSDPIWLNFVALIVVENTHFSGRTIRFVKKVILATLVLAAIVSILQISDPFFFVNDQVFDTGMSYTRMIRYYNDAPTSVSSTEAGKMFRFLNGYRLSIFSYVKELSVGIDTIALFSILIASRPANLIQKGTATISTALVSFLSSSRWIMLNFIVVASQLFWTAKNKFANLLYFILLSSALLVVMGAIANIVGLDVQQFINDRLMSDSALTRFLAFEVFFEVFPENPVFGTGGTDTDRMIMLLGGKSSQIHVGFLKLFYYYGLIGGFLYLAFMVSFLIRLWKMAKFSSYWGGFFAILAFFIANLTLFELSLYYYGPLLAIIFANHFYRVENDKPPESSGKPVYQILKKVPNV